jgi:hypothetical protein
MHKDRNNRPEPDEIPIPDYASIKARLTGKPSTPPRPVSKLTRCDIEKAEDAKRKAVAEASARIMQKKMAKVRERESIRESLPPRLYAIALEIAARFAVDWPYVVTTTSEDRHICKARFAFYYECLTRLPDMTVTELALILGHNRSSISHALSRYCRANGIDAFKARGET